MPGILTKPIKSFSWLTGDELKMGVFLKLKKAEPTMYEGDAKFAPKGDSKLFEQGVLKAGETMRYTFDRFDMFNKVWEEVQFENSSTGFYGALSNIDPDAETIFSAKRSGEGTATKYLMTVVTPEEFQAEVDKAF